MPRYEYACSNCENNFSIAHSMTETLSKCILCNTDNTVNIVPSCLYTKQTKSLSKRGELVKEYIEETKKHVQEQKKDLTRGYSNDN